MTSLPNINNLLQLLGTEPDAVFTDWRNSVPDKHWVKIDLSALRVGYELGKATAAIAALEAGRSGEAEPVAWRFKYNDCDPWQFTYYEPHTPEGWTPYAAVESLYDHPQQPPPVGVADAMVERARSAYKATKRYHTGDYPEGSIRSVADMNRNDDDAWRAALTAALSQQEAAPSVSPEWEWSVCDRDCDCIGYCKAGLKRRIVPAPVSEPAASDTVSARHIENLAEFARTAPRTYRDHDEPPPADFGPAASGEGPSVSQEIIEGWRRTWEAVAATLTEVAPGWDTPDGTCDKDRACRTIRRLTTTGQGDVERLVEAGRALVEGVRRDGEPHGISGDYPADSLIARLIEALGPWREASRG